MKNLISRVLFVIILLSINHLPAQTTDFETEITALETTTPTSAAAAPEAGTFYSVQKLLHGLFSQSNLLRD
jgi:secreted protein with Ig-like and vWFA domain